MTAFKGWKVVLISFALQDYSNHFLIHFLLDVYDLVIQIQLHLFPLNLLFYGPTQDCHLWQLIFPSVLNQFN